MRSPGGYKGKNENYDLFAQEIELILLFTFDFSAKTDPTNWTARFVNWGESNCYGRVIRGICVFGIVDLPTLVNRHELVANKFHLSADPIAYQCVEELMLNKSRINLPLNDATFYRQMPFLLPS